MSEADDAQTLFEAAREAAAEERLGDAIAGFDEIVTRFGAAADPAIEWLIGDALHAKAYCLGRLEREEEALAVYESMAARYDGADAFRGQLSRALLQKGTTLARLGRADEAIAAWDELVARFGDEREPPLAMGLVMALERKAGELRRLERLSEAVHAYDEIVVRFTDSQFPPLRRISDSALSNKVFVLLLLGRHDEAIVVANAAVERLGEAGDADALAIALLNLAGALANEQRLAEAIDVYDLLIAQLEEADNAQLRGHLMLAVSSKVDVLVRLGREDEAIEVHTDLLERYGDEVAQAFRVAATRNEPDEGAAVVVAGMLLKEALVLGELGQIQKALIATNELIGRFEGQDDQEIKLVVARAREYREQLLAEDG